MPGVQHLYKHSVHKLDVKHFLLYLTVLHLFPCCGAVVELKPYWSCL